MSNAKIIWFIIIIGMIVYIIWEYGRSEPKIDDKDLALCLKRKGVKFYGASYCKYCTRQKEMFGDSAKDLPYIECENPKNPECEQQNIDGYPTWVFQNGKKVSGLLNMEELKEYSEC